MAGDLAAAEILAALNRALPGFCFTNAVFVSGEASFHKRLQFVDFHYSWPGPMPRRDDIAALLAAGDALDFSEAGLSLKMDFAHQGQERFARVYRLLDPERKWTSRLRRTAVTFKDEN